MDKQQLETTVAKVLDEMRECPIPPEISNRRIHLCVEGYDRLLPNHPISKKEELLQPGQYAVRQTVTLVGSEGQLENVCLLGPLCGINQVEISRTDVHMLKIATPLRMSGNIQSTPGVRLVSPFVKPDLASGVIVARRRVHASPLDTLIPRVSHGDRVSIATNGDERRLTLDNVVVCIPPDMRLRMCIDTDEANTTGTDSPQTFTTLVTL